MPFIRKRSRTKSVVKRARLQKQRSNSFSYLQLESRQLLACIEVSGVIAEDTLWNSPDGYCLTGDLIVEEGAILDIEADFQVEDQIDHTLIVEGFVSFFESETGNFPLVIAASGRVELVLSQLGGSREGVNTTVDGQLNVILSTFNVEPLNVNQTGKVTFLHSTTKIGATTFGDSNTFDGDVEFIDTIVTGRKTFVSGSWMAIDSSFDYRNLSLQDDSTAVFENSSFAGSNFEALDNSTLTIRAASEFDQVNIESSLSVISSKISGVRATNADLVFDDATIGGLNVTGGTVSVDESVLEGEFPEVYVVDVENANFTDNQISVADLWLKFPASNLSWTNNEFLKNNDRPISLTLNPELVQPIKDNTAGTSNVRDSINLSGTVTKDMVLPNFHDSSASIYASNYDDLSGVEIATGARFSIAPDAQIIIPERASFSVYGILDISEGYYRMPITIVHDGGELISHRDKPEYRRGLLGATTFEAGSRGQISNSWIYGVLSINSDADVTFENSIMEGYRYQADGDPDAVIDFSGQYWWGAYGADSNIDKHILDHNDDPIRPTLQYKPTLADSPMNQEFVGTDGDDVFNVHKKFFEDAILNVNGAEEIQTASKFQNKMTLDGQGGNDKLVLTFEASSQQWDVELDFNPERAVVTYTRTGTPVVRQYFVNGFEDIEIHFIEEETPIVVKANFIDTELSDRLTVNGNIASFTNDEATYRVNGFEHLKATSSNGGDDEVLVSNILAEESFVFRNGLLRNIAETGGRTINVAGFENNTVIAPEESNSVMTVWGTENDDRFQLGRKFARLDSPSALVEGWNFSQVVARGGGGNNIANAVDSSGNDSVFFEPGQVSISNDGGVFVTILDYQQTNVRSLDGQDSAFLNDSANDDEFFGNPEFSHIIAGGFSLVARDFKNVVARSSGGADTAYFNDSPTDDVFTASEGYSALRNESFRVAAIDFASVVAKSSGGSDVAYLDDSADDDAFLSTQALARIDYESERERTALQFGNVYVNSTLGTDHAVFRGSDGDDVFVVKPESALMTGPEYQHFAIGFESNLATSTSGFDIARFVDSSSDDQLFVDGDQLRLKSSSYNSFTSGFERNFVYARRGGNDAIFLVDSEDDDYLGGQDNDLWLINDRFYHFMSGFDSAEAAANNGGRNRAEIGEILFDLDLFGDWV